MRTNCYELNIGVKDKDLIHSLALEDVKKQFEEELKKRSLDFSLSLQKGGYVSENGDYVLEDSLRLIFIGNYTEERIMNFINAIKEIYNQESVLYIRKEIDQEFVRN